MRTDGETIYRGLSHAAWGYFFLHIHFKLNGIDVLPTFVGWLLLLSAINKLSGERRDLSLLRPLAALMAAWQGLNWLLSWGGAGVSGHILFLDLLIAVAVIYFHFQFLTDMASLAERYEPPEGTLAPRLRRRRTAYILALTLSDILLDLPVERDPDVRAYLVMGLAAVGILIALFIMAGLFALRKLFWDQPDSPQA